MSDSVSRRRFLGAAGIAASASFRVPKAVTASNGKPALLGGAPVRTKPFPSWPDVGRTEEDGLLRVVRSGQWFRGNGPEVGRFEEAYARLTGSRHCLATNSGTAALFTSLNALGVEPGDEVILPPYTFVATLNVVLLQYALPVFVDTDLNTFQVDAGKVEAAITERTKVILPVHIGGAPADLDTILAIGERHRIPILEDACQAHLGEWKKRKLGSLGTCGCFSFQATKNLNSGDGGAILTDDDDLIEKCYTFHNNSRSRKSTGYEFRYRGRGANLRMTEFQAAMLQAQMTRLEDQASRRDRNGAYLTQALRDSGLSPVATYPGCTRNAYHVYMMRYKSDALSGLPRDVFIKAMQAEGIPCWSGYTPLNKEPYITETLRSRGYRALYPAKLLDEWADRCRCPVNEQVCREAVWFTQTMLLGEKSDMDQIVEAVQKIRKHAAELKNS